MQIVLSNTLFVLLAVNIAVFIMIKWRNYYDILTVFVRNNIIEFKKEAIYWFGKTNIANLKKE